MKMREYILPKGALAFVAVVAIAVGLAEFGVWYVVESNRTLTQMSCSSVGAVENGKLIGYKLNCAGREYVVDDRDTVLSLINEPREISCEVHSLGLKSCEPPEGG